MASRLLARCTFAGYSNPMHESSTSRRAVLGALAGGVAAALSSCATPLPPLPFRPTPVPTRITVVVGDAYTHVQGNPRDPQQYSSLQLVADGAIQRWTQAAEATLQGKVALTVRVADMLHATFWQEVTLNTASGSGSDTEQPLYLASHAMLRRLQAGGILADLRPLLDREHGLRGQLSADALTSLQWAGAQAGLPVALWPQLAATDARLPAPPAAWTWADAAAVPAGAGNWPVQLFPLAPTLEAWLWPQQADLLTADGTKTLIDQPAGIAAAGAYAQAFGPPPALSPVPGGGAPANLENLSPAQSQVFNAWAAQALQRRDQQIQKRQVSVWFPTGEWPPASPALHVWQDGVGPLRRLAPPGAAATGVPIIAYGLGIRADAAQPDLLWHAADALQAAAPDYLAYSPFTADQTAEGLRKRWSHLAADQATVLASILRLRLRPVWGVPTSWPQGQFAAPADVLTPAYWQRRISAVDAGTAQDFSRILTELIGTFSLVLGLGLLPPAQAAANAAQALLALMPLMQVRPT